MMWLCWLHQSSLSGDVRWHVAETGLQEERVGKRRGGWRRRKRWKEGGGEGGKRGVERLVPSGLWKERRCIRSSRSSKGSSAFVGL